MDISFEIHVLEDLHSFVSNKSRICLLDVVLEELN